MKKLFALILAVLMLAGCQLASEEKREDTTQDRLVGVFVTMDHMELDFDIEGWLNDNAIESNETFANVDPVKVIDNLFAMQDAIYMELYPELFEEQSTETAEAQG